MAKLLYGVWLLLGVTAVAAPALPLVFVSIAPQRECVERIGRGLVDVDVLVPWGTESAETVTEVIVADTVIIGKTPETYLNMER